MFGPRCLHLVVTFPFRTGVNSRFNHGEKELGGGKYLDVSHWEKQTSLKTIRGGLNALDSSHNPQPAGYVSCSPKLLGREGKGNSDPP